MSDDKKLCRWCMKRYKELSGIEKQSIMSGNWSEMCNRCNNKHERIMCTNPYAGLFGDNTRPTKSHKGDRE